MSRKDNTPQVRTLADIVEDLKETISGKDKITRLGERYYMSCHCDNFVTTADESRVTQFMNEHWENCEQK